MKRLFLAALLLLPSLALAEGVLTRAANPPQAITVLSMSGIPYIKASSGTMGNNGAVSAMTALPRTFSAGACLYLPAGAIAAGVPAAAEWYWFVGSSTTAGTVYNSICTTTGTPRVGTLTAFATTGPGAFAGLTTTPNVLTITVPANLMGVNGQVQIDLATQENTTAGNKAYTLKFGTSTCWAQTLTTQASATVYCQINNRGVANSQALEYQYAHSSAGGTGAAQLLDGVEATTANVNVTFTINTAVATDHAILESYRVVVIHGD